MQSRFLTSSNPLVQVFSLLIVGVALMLAVLTGAVILAAVFGFAMIAAIVIAVRVWWVRRKVRRGGPRERAVIEADYEVLPERDQYQRDPRD
jgi:uncharacterized protein (DUF2062 family)